MTEKELKARENSIRAGYGAYKVADIAVKLYGHGIPRDDIAYIMQGGEDLKMTPYPRLQAWLDSAMDRILERVPYEKAVEIRQDSACCLSGVRDTLAKKIYREHATIDERFEAFKNEHKIIYGKAWKENEDYYISYWYAKPATGYTCGSLRCIPEKPMNKLWCECCAGHIKHHFETALGVTAVCSCVTSVLSSRGEDACLFKLSITGIKDK